MSMPIHRRPSFSAAATAVPQPQNGSRTYIAGVAAGLDDAFQEGEELSGGIAKSFGGIGADRWYVIPNILQTSRLDFRQRTSSDGALHLGFEGKCKWFSRSYFCKRSRLHDQPLRMRLVCNAIACSEREMKIRSWPRILRVQIAIFVRPDQRKGTSLINFYHSASAANGWFHVYSSPCAIQKMHVRNAAVSSFRHCHEQRFRFQMTSFR